MSWTVLSRTSDTITRPSRSSRSALMVVNGSEYSTSGFVSVFSGAWAPAGAAAVSTAAGKKARILRIGGVLVGRGTRAHQRRWSPAGGVLAVSRQLRL